MYGGMKKSRKRKLRLCLPPQNRSLREEVAPRIKNKDHLQEDLMEGDPGAVKEKRGNQVLQMWEGGTFLQEGRFCPQWRKKEKVIPLMTFDEKGRGGSGALLHWRVLPTALDKFRGRTWERRGHLPDRLWSDTLLSCHPPYLPLSSEHLLVSGVKGEGFNVHL